MQRKKSILSSNPFVWSGFRIAVAIVGIVLPGMASARPFTDYFKPIPIVCPPTSNIWGDKAVLPRDTCNGLEDTSGTPSVRPKWMYWDGKILRGSDGKYHMYASRWSHANGMGAWRDSEIIHATSPALMGPYADQGYAFNDGPDTRSPHKGHNVTAAELPDGTFCLIVNEIVPFTIFTSNSAGGPWTSRGRVAIESNGVQINIPQPGDQNLASNVSFVVRHDGTFQIIQRHGIIATSATLLGPYKIQKPTTTYPTGQTPPANLATIFPNRPKHLSTAAGAPQNPESVYVYAEDPIIWYSGGQYHVIYNYPDDRIAYHLTSRDGIHDWTDQGLAFDPREGQKIFSNEDGSALRWFNVERPNVIMEDGHVAYFTFAVSDAFKMGISGSSNNNTKVVVVPFDGVRFDQETGIGVDGGVADGGGSGGTSGSSSSSGRGGMDGGAGGSAGRDTAMADARGGSAAGAGGSAGTSAASSSTGGASVPSSSSGGTSTPRSSSAGAAGSGGASGGTAAGGRGGTGGSASLASGTAGSGGTQPSGGSGGRPASGSSIASGTSQSGSSASGCSCTLADANPNRRGWLGLLSFFFALALLRRRTRARRSYPEANEPKSPFPGQS